MREGIGGRPVLQAKEVDKKKIRRCVPGFTVFDNGVKELLLYWAVGGMIAF